MSLDTSSTYVSVETAAAGSSMNAADPQVNDYEPEEDPPFDDAEYNEAIRRSRRPGDAGSPGSGC